MAGASTSLWLRLQQVRLVEFGFKERVLAPLASGRELALSPTGRHLSCLSGGSPVGKFHEPVVDLECREAATGHLRTSWPGLSYPGPNRTCSAWRPHHDELDYLQKNQLHRCPIGATEVIVEDVGDWAWSADGNQLYLVNGKRSQISSQPAQTLASLPARVSKLSIVGTCQRTLLAGGGRLLGGNP